MSSFEVNEQGQFYSLYIDIFPEEFEKPCKKIRTNEQNEKVNTFGTNERKEIVSTDN